MRLTCPHCQSLCRLKDDRLNSRAKRGKCPNCGNLFPIPANEIEQGAASANRQTTLKQSSKNSRHDRNLSADSPTEPNSQKNFLKQTRPTIRSPLSLTITGISLLIILLAITLLNLNQPNRAPQKKRAKAIAQPRPVPLPAPTLELAPTLKTKVISLIKHHALVTDAGININKQQFELALLVSEKTPVSYSERLGRQFAHYIKNELTPDNKAKATFMVSVYYPDGTRIEVTTNDNNMDEEIIRDPPVNNSVSPEK